MKASQLRDLTRNFAAGKMDRSTYVAERTRLIDGVVSGEIGLRYRELEPFAPTTEKRGRHRWFRFAVIVLVGLLLVALVAHFFGETPSAPASAEQSANAVPTNPGVELLADFNGSSEWSETALADLEAQWSALTTFQQENARRSAEYRQLKHETTRRIHEQEALLAAGEMEALVKAVRLREFGERMGFPVER